MDYTVEVMCPDGTQYNYPEKTLQDAERTKERLAHPFVTINIVKN
jgi:hypothetical protein